MRESLPAAPTPSPWTADDLARRHLVVGALASVVGVVTLAVASWEVGVALLVTGAFFIGIAGVVRLSGFAVPLLNTSFNALLQGRVAEAERILDRIEGRRQLGYVHRAVDLQRASIALRRGDLAAARVRVEAALARPPGLFTRGQEDVHLTSARAVRALILASLGDREGARADAEAVRRLPWAPAEALARAEVAEAIALESAGDREALAAHLAQKRALLLDSTAPRERAVVRAYQRMLAAPKSSVYRRSAVRDAAEAPGPEGGEPALADWIAKVAPAAAPFAPPARARATAIAEAAEDGTPPGLIRVAEARLAPKASTLPASRAKVAAAWVLLVVFFTAVWQVFRSDGGQLTTAFDLLPGSGVLAAVFLGVLAAVIASAMVRSTREDRRLATALGALARGEAGAQAEIAAIAAVASSPAAPQAYLELARLAVRRADFEEAVRLCDKGTALLAERPAARTAASSMLLPSLVAERAFALAATDRHDKAAAEMAVLVKAFPAYPFLARAKLRVGLVQRVRRGDLAGAARVAEASTDDLPLPLRDETLLDLVRATAGAEPRGAGEEQRLRDDLRVDRDLHDWIAAVAPEVLRVFENGGGASCGPPPAEVSTEAPGDAEREAEAEALAALEAPRVMRGPAGP